MTSGSGITQGISDAQRIGTSSMLTGFKFRLLLGQPSDRPNVVECLSVVQAWHLLRCSSCGSTLRGKDIQICYIQQHDDLMQHSRRTPAARQERLLGMRVS